MQGIPLSQFFKIIQPKYTFIQLTPHTSIRNNTTHRIAKTINSLYKPLAHRIKKEEAKIIQILGRRFLVGTRYSLTLNSKVGYFIYMEKSRIEFYMIVPTAYYNILKEKIVDTWLHVTVNIVDQVPTFSDEATKYQLHYFKEDGLSLAVDRRTNELLESNLNVLDVLEEGDKAGIFYNFTPISQFNWNSSYQSTILKIKKGMPVNRNKIDFNYVFRFILSALSDLLDDVASLFDDKEHALKTNTQITAFEQALQEFITNQKISTATKSKGTDIVLDTQILVVSEGKDLLRQRNTAKSLVHSFDCIAEDNCLVHKVYQGPFRRLETKLAGIETNKIGSKECGNFLALPGRGLLERYDCIKRVQTQETEVPKELRQGVICLGESVFKGHQQKAYLSNDFDFRMLSLVLIGPNRAGKSKFLANTARAAINAGESVILPDYIGSCQLSEEVAGALPIEKVLEIRCDSFEAMQGLGYNEVPFSKDIFIQYRNAKEMTALFMTLVDSINADDANFSAKMGRYLEAAALVVFLSSGSINDVFTVLLNHKRRKEYINRIPKNQKENMIEYIDYLQELDEFDRSRNVVVGTRSHLIAGIIDRLHKLKVNAYLEMMLKKGTRENINLVKELQKPQLIVLKMPQRMFLTDNEKDIYVTYWLTKVWLALQIREEQIRDRKKMTKVNLIIDELYQVNHSERFLTKKLSQLPKFNIKPIISCHYLNQLKIIREELRSVNASYMLLAGCDKKNYNELASELHPYTEEDLLGLSRYHSLNLIKYERGYGRFITKLPPPISK